MILCTYEDRPTAEIGLRLLIASLEHHLPGTQLLVFGRFDHAFTTWATSDTVTIREPPDGALAGWDVKPAILLDVLAESPGEPVAWIDSDIILTDDIAPIFGGSDPDVLVAAEEHRWVTGQGVPTRTTAIGRAAVRVFPRALNTCLLRVTSAHGPLLRAWHNTLLRPDYREAQSQSFEKRRWYLGSDQDMLSALLGAEDFAHIPVRQLRSGIDVAHCFLAYGYGTTARLRNLRKLPPLVHAQGPKPWELPGAAFAELSPYTAVAARYTDRVGVPLPWTTPSTPTSRLWNSITRGSPNLRGLPLATAAELRLTWQRQRPATRRASTEDAPSPKGEPAP